MEVALRELSAGERLFRLRRLAAIWIGLGFSLVMTLGIAVLAMDRNASGHGWLVLAAIAGSFWLQVATVLAAQSGTRIWPAVLVFVTVSVYVATACTLAIANYWVVSFYWLAVAVTVLGGIR